MTISYQRDVASSTAGGFTRLLFKWKGSLYKLIYRELLLFISAYILLSLVYRQVLTGTQKQLFEMVVIYFDAFLNLIPLSFVLGFYVSYVANRWWQQFLAIPWPDKLFHSIACYIEGFDEESRLLRRSLMRYMNLALILVLRSISSAVKQRFPSLDHVVEAGFMTKTEMELFSAVPANEFNTYWVPCTWFIYRLQEATKKGKLLNQYALENIMREFCEFRAKCGLLWCYDWVSIPMVYTQVVTIATYLFFTFTLIGRQKIDDAKFGPDMNTVPKKQAMRSGRIPLEIDLYIPIFTILQFFFYMGLLKVAEQLINPFGDDDEDFELNWLIDRHFKASFLGCDVLMNPERIPPMVKDYYWDKQDCPIPYTEASRHLKISTYRGSAADMIIPPEKCHMIYPDIDEEDEPEDPKRSLDITSLLLESSNIVTGLGLGEMDVQDGFADANLRNGRARGSLQGNKLSVPAYNQQSFDSTEPEEEDSDRRGSLSERRSSKLSDIFLMQEKRGKRRKEKRYKDKQGFTWSRMAPGSEDLPNPRVPHLNIPQDQLPAPQDQLPTLTNNSEKDPNFMDNQRLVEARMKRTPSTRSAPIPPQDLDTYSPQSVRSEVFKTAPNTPATAPLPRKISVDGKGRQNSGQRPPPPNQPPPQNQPPYPIQPPIPGQPPNQRPPPNQPNNGSLPHPPSQPRAPSQPRPPSQPRFPTPQPPTPQSQSQPRFPTPQPPNPNQPPDPTLRARNTPATSLANNNGDVKPEPPKAKLSRPLNSYNRY